MADRYYESGSTRWGDEADRYREAERYRDQYDRGRRYRGEGYYGGWYGSPEREAWRPSREHGRGREDRGFFDRAGDEVRSWFGDEDAQRRRTADEREGDRGWGSERGSGGRWWPRSEERRGGTWYAGEPNEREWARQWGYVEGRGRDWASRDWEWSAPSRSGSSSWPSEGYVGSWSYGQAGPFVGRGPRGYQRSDERIREDICERMSQHGELDASDIEVRVANAEVTIAGNVTSREAKRLAEDIAESVSGVRDVHNQVHVSSSTQEPQRGWSGQQRAA